MLEIKQLSKTYRAKGVITKALKDVNLIFGARGMIVLTGKSGSGKTTLLNIIGGLDRFDSGEIIIKNKSAKNFTENMWDDFRNTYVGFVFQEFYLIEEFTVGKNISLALELQDIPKEEIDKRVETVLSQVGLEGYKDKKPNETSGGQKQRIAIARALIKNPEILLCDEPTGNLDSETGRLILETLKKLSATKLVILVTHDREFAQEYGERIIELKDGEVSNDIINHEQRTEQEVFFEKVNDEQVVKIPKGNTLSPNVISYLNTLIHENGHDLILSVSSNKGYVARFADLNQETIEKPDVSSILNSENNEPIHLRPSVLSIKNALRIGISSLFHKKLRLIITTLLFVFALIMVGIAANLNFYNSSTAAVKTFLKYNVTAFPIIKHANYCYNNSSFCPDLNESMTFQDFNEVRAAFPDASAVQNIYYFLPLQNFDGYASPVSQSNFYSGQINHITIIDHDSEALFPLKSGAYPQTDDEILITDYLADMLVYFGIVPDSGSVIGATLKDDMNHYSMKISGIITTDYEQYDDLKTDTGFTSPDWQVFNNKMADEYSTIYMHRALFNTLSTTADVATEMNIYNGGGTIKTIQAASPEVSYNGVLHGRLPQTDAEVVIPATRLYIYFNDVNLKFDNPDSFIGKNINIPLNNYDRFQNESKTLFTVTGIIDDTASAPCAYSVMFSQDLFDYFKFYTPLEIYMGSRSLVFATLYFKNTDEDARLVSYLNTHGYKHATPYSQIIYEISDIAQNGRMIILYIGLGLAIFAILLIMTYITSSVKSRTRDIGTLRAIGAKGGDVAKIFIAEALILGLSGAIIADAGATLIIYLINVGLSSAYHLHAVILYTNIYSIFFVLVLAIVFVMLAVYLPVKRLLRMKPIQSINKI